MRAAIQAAVGAAFAAMSDLKTSVTYRRGAGSYSPTTGQVTPGATTHTVLGIFFDFESNQIDNVAIRATDKQFLFEASQIAFEPSLTDKIQSGSTVWEIKNLSKDPAGATWTLQIRKA